MKPTRKPTTPKNTMRTHTMHKQAPLGECIRIPLLDSMLEDLLSGRRATSKPKTRRKIFAVMSDGSEKLIFRNRWSGWNLPNGNCFTSHLSSAKQAWIDAGAKIVTRTI